MMVSKRGNQARTLKSFNNRFGRIPLTLKRKHISFANAAFRLIDSLVTIGLDANQQFQFHISNPNCDQPQSVQRMRVRPTKSVRQRLHDDARPSRLVKSVQQQGNTGNYEEMLMNQQFEFHISNPQDDQPQPVPRLRVQPARRVKSVGRQVQDDTGPSRPVKIFQRKVRKGVGPSQRVKYVRRNVEEMLMNEGDEQGAIINGEDGGPELSVDIENTNTNDVPNKAHLEEVRVRVDSMHLNESTSPLSPQNDGVDIEEEEEVEDDDEEEDEISKLKRRMEENLARLAEDRVEFEASYLLRSSFIISVYLVLIEECPGYDGTISLSDLLYKARRKLGERMEPRLVNDFPSLEDGDIRVLQDIFARSAFRLVVEESGDEKSFYLYTDNNAHSNIMPNFMATIRETIRQLREIESTMQAQMQSQQ